MLAVAKTRVQFVDVLRLIALAQMVNGHTLHAVLTPVVRGGAFYERYLWFRGLVSVAFMLAAGFAFHITTGARLLQQRDDRAGVRRRVLRAFELIAIGFLLRLPLASLLAFDVPALARGLLGLARIDVLPCIGVSLLVLEALAAVCRRPWQLVAASTSLAIGCALLVPWGASLPVQGGLAFVNGWLGPQGGSQFPLLPYAGYVFAGVALGALALPQGGRTEGSLPGPRLLAGGSLLLALGGLASWIPAARGAANAAALQSPAFLLQKLAAVTIAIGVLAYALRRLRALPAVLRVLSAETLAMYVFHLLVLYGEPFDLHRRAAESLQLGQALGVSALMLIATSGFGLAWHAFKGWHPARRVLPSGRATVLASVGLLSAALLLVATHVHAAPPQVNTNGTAYAIGGYDPVAYFEPSAPMRGKPQWRAQHAGATWLFASEAHRQAFVAAPGRYAPAYLGYCAYAAAQGRLVTIDPQAFAVVDGRLFLNYSLEVRAKWQAQRARFIELADAFFAKLTQRVSVRSIALTVADLDEAARFFVDALGFTREGAVRELQGPELAGLTGLPGARARRVALRLGRERIELIAYAQPAARPAPSDTHSNDLWFQHLALVASDIDASRARVLARGAAAISTQAQTIPRSNADAGGIRAFYFRGPAQHPLELIWYPRDKGMARWHAAGAGALLGIDHTAIAVADSERSRAFYVDLLGLSVAGHSFNQGREQAALSGVPGARVRITGLRGDDGPGLEFLEYEAPRGGRTAPSDTRPSDLWQTELTLAVSDLDSTLRRLRASGVRFVSDRVSDTRELVAGSTRGVIVRDPDGHAVRVVQ